MSDAEFETLKALVRSQFGLEIGFGITAVAISEALGANPNYVDAALSACEEDGDAWILNEHEANVDAFWSGDSMSCNEKLPLAYVGSGAPLVVSQPPLKKMRVENAASEHYIVKQQSGSAQPICDDPFEELKLFLHVAVAAAGQAGVTSGKLGYDNGADRKAVTAALYACQSDGLVRNLTEGGMPRWVSIMAPSAQAQAASLPMNYSYKGDKAPAAKQSKPAAAVQQQIRVSAPAAASAVAAGSANPVAALNEWSQKARKNLSFVDAGQCGGGFLCKVLVDNQLVATQQARNKKQAKTSAAAAALEALGIK